MGYSGVRGGMEAIRAAERLVRHLERSGYVLMRRPPADAPSASRHGRAP